MKKLNVVRGLRISSQALRPFNRAKVRELVRKRPLPPNLLENNVVDLVISRFQSMSIPLTGPHISIFLTVISSEKKFNPVNASTVIENFVEALLDKPDLKKIYRNGMDYRETVDLLGHIAEIMVRDNSYSFSPQKIRDIIRDYYLEIGISRSSEDVVISLMTANVLTSGESITFKYNIIFSFFVAYRMKEHKEFLDYILEKDRFTSYVHEIDICCGLSRRDVAILNRVANHYSAAFEHLDDELKRLANSDYLTQLKLPSDDDADEFAAEFAKALGSKEVRGAQRGKFENQPVAQNQFRQTLARKPVKDSLFYWIYALRAYSVCVKNLEIISSTDKIKHLQIVLDGWAKLTTLVVAILGTCFEGDGIEFKIGETRFSFDLKGKIDGKMLRLLLMYIPAYMSSFVRLDVGSEKLSLQLEGMEPNNSATDLLRTGLIAAMKLPGFAGFVKRYLKTVAGDRYLVGAMGWVLRDIFLRFGFSSSEEDSLRRMISEIEADLQGVKGPERSRFISQQDNILAKRKLVVTLRE